MPKTAFLFPGQGSQFVGMGKSFFENNQMAKDVFGKADDILGFSLTDLCFKGPEEGLKKTENTQPALFTVSVIAARLLRDKGIDAEFLAGHSLGECTALWAAGCLDFEQGLKLVRKRGEVMAEAGRRRPGAMAAILGLNPEQVTAVCKETEKTGAGIVGPANFNSPGQIVISGERAAVEKAMEITKIMYGKYSPKAILLPVSGAFHSSLLTEASEEFTQYLEGVPFKEPQKTVVSNVNADVVRNATEIRDALKEQLKSTVRWEECIGKLKNSGIEFYFEVGAGRVLSGLMRRIDKQLKCVQAGEWDDIQQLTIG